MAMKIFVSKITDFIDSIMPGLYHLKKTYPEESNLVAKIDSIIVTLIDFKDSTDLYQLIEETWDWAIQIKPKQIKYMEYEIDKGMYSYWKKELQ